MSHRADGRPPGEGTAWRRRRPRPRSQCRHRPSRRAGPSPCRCCATRTGSRPSSRRGCARDPAHAADPRWCRTSTSRSCARWAPSPRRVRSRCRRCSGSPRGGRLRTSSRRRRARTPRRTCSRRIRCRPATRRRSLGPCRRPPRRTCRRSRASRTASPTAPRIARPCRSAERRGRCCPSGEPRSTAVPSPPTASTGCGLTPGIEPVPTVSVGSKAEAPAARRAALRLAPSVQTAVKLPCWSTATLGCAPFAVASSTVGPGRRRLGAAAARGCGRRSRPAAARPRAPCRRARRRCHPRRGPRAVPRRRRAGATAARPPPAPPGPGTRWRRSARGRCALGRRYWRAGRQVKPETDVRSGG